MFNFRVCNYALKGLITIGLLFATMHLAIAAETDAVDESEWKFAAEAYLWAPQMLGTTPTGSNFEIPFHDILDSLDMTVMARVGARKDKLTLFTDVIYMDLSTDKNGSHSIAIGPREKKTLVFGDTLDVGLKSWVVQPTAAYTVVEEEKYSIDLLAGARYVWIEVDLDLKETGPFGKTKKGSTTGSDHNWDGIVGVKGEMDLTDKWSAVAYADGGTGDSDYTVQGLAALNYKFDSFEGRLGYRYLKWEFDDGKALGNLLEDLTIKGPYVGGLYKF